jgi:hypothetical protein
MMRSVVHMFFTVSGLASWDIRIETGSEPTRTNQAIT